MPTSLAISMDHPRGRCRTRSKTGRDVLFDIDWQGAQQITNSSLGQHTLSIFILPPSITELRRRLVSRAQDDEETISTAHAEKLG